MDTFPITLFPPLKTRPLLAGQTEDGGTSFVGPGQVLDWSDGGWWVVQYSGITLLTPTQIRLWRALGMRLSGGSSEMIIPVLDRAQAPWPAGVPVATPLVPHSDGTPFSDGSLYAGTTLVYQLEAAIAEGATSARIRRVAGGDLVGGELLSLTHTVAGKRMYGLEGVWPVDGEADLFDVTFGPHARGPALAAADVDFETPGFVGKLISGNGEHWPAIDHPNMADAAIMFVESFDYLREAA